MSDVRRAGPGRYLVRDATGSSRVAFAAAAGSTVWVFLDGQVHEIGPAASGREGSKGDDTHVALSAPMPARVAHITVEPGQAVEAGQTLIVLEAMKMEWPIMAPRAGVVGAIACRVGELVSPHVPLVELI